MQSVNFLKPFNITKLGVCKNDKSRTKAAFCSNPDSVTIVNEAAAFNSPLLVEFLIESNPQLKTLLQSNNLSLNRKALALLESNHLPTTKKVALGIAQFVKNDNIDYKVIAQASTLHDIGKIFIPESILNKKGKLTPAERKIMHLHPVLGYELLKNTKINSKVLNSIKYHHQKFDNTGYPECEVSQFDINTQIVSVADKYSALTESRSYKKSMSKYEALSIIEEDVRDNKVSPQIYNALVNYLGL